MIEPSLGKALRGGLDYHLSAVLIRVVDEKMWEQRTFKSNNFVRNCFALPLVDDIVAQS